MPPIRRHMRIADTQDLWARLRSRGRSETADRVLNLSKGGVLVAGGELDVGEIVSFELSGLESSGSPASPRSRTAATEARDCGS